MTQWTTRNNRLPQITTVEDRHKHTNGVHNSRSNLRNAPVISGQAPASQFSTREAPSAKTKPEPHASSQLFFGAEPPQVPQRKASEGEGREATGAAHSLGREQAISAQVEHSGWRTTAGPRESW